MVTTPDLTATSGTASHTRDGHGHRGSGKFGTRYPQWEDVSVVSDVPDSITIAEQEKRSQRLSSKNPDRPNSRYSLHSKIKILISIVVTILYRRNPC